MESKGNAKKRICIICIGVIGLCIIIALAIVYANAYRKTARETALSGKTITDSVRVTNKSAENTYGEELKQLKIEKQEEEEARLTEETTTSEEQDPKDQETKDQQTAQGVSNLTSNADTNTDSANASGGWTSTQTRQEATEVISYNPQTVVNLVTAKMKANGRIYIPDNLSQMLAEGSITQEEYNEYYPTDGTGWFEYSVDTNLANNYIYGQLLDTEKKIAEDITGQYMVETNMTYFYIEYNRTEMYGSKQIYVFRCYRG